MKNILMLFMALALTSTTVIAQASEEIMKQRASEMHSLIKVDDADRHKEFILKNYSKKLLEKYEMERHTGMFKMINKDFSDSKIVSMKTNVKENKLLMLIERNSDKHQVTFDISYDPKDNYKINGMGIEAGEM